MICLECNTEIKGRMIKGMCSKCYQKSKQPVYPLPEYGEVKYTHDGKLVCHICGKAFLKLASHTTQTHNLSEKEYKKKFGLNLYTGLASEETKAKLRKAIEENYDKVVVNNLVANEKSHVTRFTKGHPGRTKDKVSEQCRKKLIEIGTKSIQNNRNKGR